MPLSRHAHAAAVGEDLVLLDVRGDRYLCLPGCAEALPALLGDAPEDPEGPVQAALGAAGLWQAAPRPAPPPLPPRPRRDARDGRGLQAGLGDAALLAAAHLDLLAGYVGRPFPQVLAFAARGRSRTRAAPDEAARLAAAFDALMVWAPAPGKCLVRGFLLARMLRRAGVAADWVFGVRVWPFAAHCWVQAGDMALNERPERLHGFVPILAA